MNTIPLQSTTVTVPYNTS